MEAKAEDLRTAPTGNFARALMDLHYHVILPCAVALFDHSSPQPFNSIGAIGVKELRGRSEEVQLLRQLWQLIAHQIKESILFFLKSCNNLRATTLLLLRAPPPPYN